jgi:N-acetylglucosaminyldiphosphoundecaprenol N-acetyl-beta-D-mannosaminyltransferase
MDDGRQTSANRPGSIALSAAVEQPPSLDILGVRVDAVTYDEALARIEAFVRAGGPHQVVTVNPEFIMEAQHNAAFRNVLNRAALNVPDGARILWAARRLGRPLAEQVAGVDLVERIAARAAQRGWRVFLLGAAAGVAERTAQVLTGRYAGLTIVGTYAGSPAPEEEESIVARIRTAQPDILLVAYGAPAQDLWLARNLARTGAAVGMGVGGSFDYIAGVIKRAPRWMRERGLEWLYRLIRQPWRWRRMAVLPRFVIAVMRQQ